ncbi:MAG: hypothetical protein WDW38_008839 [Sanguina aurantia]
MIREVCSSPDPLTKYAASCLAATVRKLIHTRSAAHTHSPPPAAGCQLSSTTPGAARTRPLDAGEHGGSDRQQASHPPAAADSHDAAARPAASICLASQG